MDWRRHRELWMTNSVRQSSMASCITVLSRRSCWTVGMAYFKYWICCHTCRHIFFCRTTGLRGQHTIAKLCSSKFKFLVMNGEGGFVLLGLLHVWGRGDWATRDIAGHWWTTAKLNLKAPRRSTWQLRRHGSHNHGNRNTLNSLSRRHRPKRKSSRPSLSPKPTQPIQEEMLTTPHRRQNNPLHISIFPSYDPATRAFAPIRTPLQFSLLLSSTVDVFDLRARHNAASNVGLSGDLGLLHAVDDRLAAYGFETNTGVRLVCVVDMRGRRVDGSAATTGLGGGGGGGGPAVRPGLRDAELKPAFRAMQAAYVRLLQNPFYEPDEHSPLGGKGGRRITSRRFAEDMRRIGEGWTPGVTSL